MRKVEIAPGVFSSILGFGCAPILGSVGGKVASRAIDCALDCGVTHFDLARSYGFGEAEEFVGKHLGAKRDQVVLTSKFGIRANWKAGVMRPIKPLIRALRSSKKTVASSISAPTVADRFHEKIPLTSKGMQDSLNASLRALRTDYLDIFLVHEPTKSLTHFEELMVTGEQLKSEGKIRAFGLAFWWDDVGNHQAYLNRAGVLQFNNSPGVGHYHEVLQSRGNERNIFFSPLRNRIGTAEVTLRKVWADFPQSLILCSMFREEHIRQNALWASEKP